MKRSIFVHQFNQMSEQTAADYAATLLPRGIDTIYAKALDGMNWMANFYSHHFAPIDAQHWGQIRQEFLDVGLNLYGWAVPRWVSAEANRHLYLNPLIVDFEYQYAGFWKGSDTEAWGYFDALRQGVVDGQSVLVAPDPRQVGRDYEAGLIAGLSAYLPQTYWTDFQQDAIAVLEHAWSTMHDLGAFQPILPYNATPDDIRAALEWCLSDGITGVSLWRMGTANSDQLDAFAQKAPGESEVPPEVDCQAYKDALERAVNRLQIELDKKTIKGRPAPLNRVHVAEIQSELFQALQAA